LGMGEVECCATSVWKTSLFVHFIKKNPTRCNNISKFYYSIFTWSSTCFGRHNAHHQEPIPGLAASVFSYVDGCDMWLSMEHWWNGTDGTTDVLGETPVLVPPYPSQIPHALACYWIRTSAVRDRQLTAWSMVWPKKVSEEARTPDLRTGCHAP
jgi:hypothetical protein